MPIKSAYNASAYQTWQTLLSAGALYIVIDDADKAIKRIIGGK